MRHFKIYELIYTVILIAIFTLAILLFIYVDDKSVAFAFALIGIVIPIIDNIIKPFQEKKEEKFKESQKVKELYNSIQDFFKYLESKQYWANPEKKDEKINTKILSLHDNIEDLRKYFGYNIINEERGQYKKKITILEGRYIITFRNSKPFESFINKIGRVRGPFKLYEENNTALEIKDLMYTEIKNKLKNKYNLKL